MTIGSRLALAALALFTGAHIAHANEREAPFEKFTLDTLLATVTGQLDPSREDTARQFLTIAGREDLAMNAASKTIVPRSTCEPEMDSGKPRDPIAAILDRAAEVRLVVVNEAHDDPQSRAFIADLLEGLHGAGITLYAAETFYSTIAPQGPLWPRMSDGFYSREPAFGELIRRARSMNLTFVAYESQNALPQGATMHDRIAHRESIQTQNLMDRLLKPYPLGRALIHVGHSHVSESPAPSPDGGETRWMANRLKNESGIDPLTIDQTIFRSPLGQPVVCALLSPKDRKLALPTDMTIALPEASLRDGRPAWRLARGQKSIAIPAGLRSPNLWTIIEARREAEPDDAVPIDRLLIGPGESLPLLLPPGRFRVAAWTREQGWTKSQILTIE